MAGTISRARRRLFETAARRPGGWLGRLVYGSLTRLSSFDRLALDKLQLEADDRYLEIGPGGGGLLARALEVAASGGAIDHSPDMVRLALSRNAAAVEAGRCEIVCGDAQALPWPDDAFTTCACVATFLFFDRPVAALSEMRRVLAPGGRVVIITPGEDAPAFLKGLHSDGEGVYLYSNETLADLMRHAGFAEFTVDTEQGRLVAVGRV
jgi:SAM-dependent methyltransferase